MACLQQRLAIGGLSLRIEVRIHPLLLGGNELEPDHDFQPARRDGTGNVGSERRALLRAVHFAEQEDAARRDRVGQPVDRFARLPRDNQAG